MRGASSCDELFAQAAVLGIEGLGIVDRNSLAGLVRLDRFFVRSLLAANG